VIPASAKVFTRQMDPYERLDWIAELSGTDGLLETGETIASFTLTMGAEGAALGVSVLTAAPYTAATTDAAKSVRFWLEVDEAFRENAAFNDAVSIPITLSLLTSNVPARRRQRTMVVEFIQK
jgi:hypothetical protein